MTSLLSIDDIFRMILNFLKTYQIYDMGEGEINQSHLRNAWLMVHAIIDDVSNKRVKCCKVKS
jgi:hypothetical protein